MKRSRIAAMMGALVFLAACSSGGGQGDARPTASSVVTSASPSPTVAAQTAIPDGIYRTRERTTHDLIALGLTKSQIAAAKENEQWTKTIVYELRIEGNQYLLSASSDGGAPIVADEGTFTVDGDTITTTYAFDPTCTITYSFSMTEGALDLVLVDNPCKEIDPEHSAGFLVRAAYETLPFEAVS